MKMPSASAHAVTQSGTWVSYAGTTRIVLALVLVAAAVGVAYAGARLRLPFRPTQPGRTAGILILVTWALAIVAFLVCLTIYAKQARQQHLLHAVPANNVAPVTAICVVGIFFAVLVIGRTRSQGIMLASAAIAAMAAPMIFEFPFDLIVMARTYPAIPPDPAVYRVLFFAPLFLVEVTTLSLLTFSPMVKVSRTALFSFALMLVVFAGWGLTGFAYPSSPASLAFNALSKIVAFVAALCLFLPQRAQAGTPDPAASPSATVTHPELQPASAPARVAD
ncbi:MAG: hypothetical protein ACRDOU_04910 [Streptosporangiaceae bacterium]